jgi:hypothetical protein
MIVGIVHAFLGILHTSGVVAPAAFVLGDVFKEVWFV